MRLAELVQTRKLSLFAGSLAIALGASFAFRAHTLVAPPVVDIEDHSDITVNVRDAVGAPCESDVTTQGARVFVHLREDPATCSGVVRVYRVEGDKLIFEQELIDI